MSKLLRICSLAITGALLGGCVSAPRTVGDDQVQFKETPTSTFALANKAPVSLPAGADQSERARLLYGFPVVHYFEMGYLQQMMLEKSDDQALGFYTNKGSGYSAGSNFKKADGVGLGLAIGGAAGGALAVTSALAGNAVDYDVRQMSSSALCFIPLAEAPSAQASVDKCSQIVLEHLKSALANSKVDNRPAQSFVVTGAPIPGDEQKLTMVGVFKSGAYYAKGFAPAELGGYEAHVAYVQLLNLPVLEANAPTIEEVVTALKQGKPANVAYMFSAGHDARKRKGLDPLGLF